ncbi:hypothetical protein CYMTET_48029 [Cymbomonas tetramitiformis]|uniref:Reverse transcriptase domain-containing protein n=1 Tax=Cymbomonas tetramitiformis TaxID=36881 RepID=A0AAE0EW52_9CHLO|nr:hypothetical protein CYMTET_48029 [Cymbomonas tetramitiformis]
MSTGGIFGPSEDVARWAAWTEEDASELLRFFLPLGTAAGGARSQLVLADWNGASYDALSGMAALARQLQMVPQTKLLAVRELVEMGLLVESAGAVGHPVFVAAGEWKLPGTWSRGGKMEATIRLRALRKWAQEMLDGPSQAWQVTTLSAGGTSAGAAVSPGSAGASGGDPSGISPAVAAAGPGSGGATGAAPQLTEERVQQLLNNTVAKAIQDALVAQSAATAAYGLHQHGGDLDEFPPAEEANVEDWWVFVQLARERVAEMQRFARGKGGGPYHDVMDDSFFRKRPRSTSPDPGAGGAPAAATALLAGAPPEIPQLTATRRSELAAQAAGMRTLPQEVLAQALQSGDVPDNIGSPPGAGPFLGGYETLRPVVPRHDGSALRGHDLRVYPTEDLVSRGEKRVVIGQGGQLTWAGKEPKERCTSPLEWERGFWTMARSVPTLQHKLLLYFHTWFVTKVAEYSFTAMAKLYHFFIVRMETDDSVSFKLGSYSDTFAAYVAETNIQPQGGSGGAGGGKRSKAKWDQYRQPQGGQQGAPAGGDRQQPVAPAGKGKGKGKGRGKGGKRGGLQTFPHIRDATTPQREVEEIEGDLPTGQQQVTGCCQRRNSQGDEMEIDKRWRHGLVPTSFIPVWDVAGLPLRREGQSAPGWRYVPGVPGAGIRAIAGALDGAGGIPRVAVPLLTERARIMAAAFSEWHDVDFLVRGAACGVGWPYEPVKMNELFRVPDYVGDEHMEAMEREIDNELRERRIFPADDRPPLGVSALGMVEKLRNGKVKYRPVLDYSKLAVFGVNDRIKLEHDKFSSVKDAYGLVRPGKWMIKVDLDSAYRSVGVASQYGPPQCFEFGGVRYFDARAPFGNRALPSIFMRYTRAIVGWMQAQSVPTVGYLDDFFCMADTKEEAKEIMMMLVEFVTLLGFKVNSAKCEGPGRRMEFLSMILSTEGERCTAEVSEERIAFVLKPAKEVEEQATRAAVRRKALESLLGLLAFCGQVVWGLSLYTRRGFALLAASGRRRWVQVSRAVLEDIRVLERVIRLYNGRKVVLFRKDAKEDWIATNASGTKGMGRLLDKLFFLYSWDDVKRMVQRPWFPFQKDKEATHHINYLELFAVWWALALWGRRLGGRTVVIRIDNQCALRQVDKLWGPVDYLPLLEQIFYLCARWDVRLRPVYINTKDNLLADLLSRLDLQQFHLEHRAFMRASIWRQDRDDWMLHPALWHELDVEFGPFTLDSCVAVSRANAFCMLSWSKEEDARVQAFDGHNAWGNLPFSIMLDILRNFLKCKQRRQMGTAGTFLVPVWDGNEAWELVKALPDVFKCQWPYLTGRKCAGAEELLEALQQEAQRYEGAALADNTKGSYKRSFLTFCIYFACLGCMAPLLPATDETLILFITFLSWFVAPDTIKSYMAGVRQLHLQRGFEWEPVAQRHRVAATLQGVRRFWGRPSKPVMPLTLQNLADMVK